jgi:hypothetical protein
MSLWPFVAYGLLVRPTGQPVASLKTTIAADVVSDLSAIVDVQTCPTVAESHFCGL